MTNYNDTFTLNPRDIALIEALLRREVSALAEAGLAGGASAADSARVHQCQDLLGKLHNQKIWYAQIHCPGAPSG